MKLGLFLLLLIMLLAFTGLLYFQDPGHVNIRWLGYEIQMSAIIGLLCLGFSFLILLFLLKFLSWLWRSLFGKRAFFDKKMEQALLDILSAYEAENFSEGLRLENKAPERLKKNPLFLWISGNLFAESEKAFEAEQNFMELAKSTPTAFLGLKGKIRAALHRKDLITASDLLHHAQKIMPSSPWILKHLLALTRERKNYADARVLILRLTDLGYIPADNSKKQLAHLYYQQAIQDETPADQKEIFLREAHLLNPGLAEATETLAPLLEKQGHTTYALTALQATWILSPTQKLGELYLEMSKPKDALAAYQMAKKFVKNSAKHPESLLFLARAALKAQLWGEARAHLTQLLLLKQGATALAYQLLSQLEWEQHQDEKAARAWLEKGVLAPRHV